jgi:hypothetical protein
MYYQLPKISSNFKHAPRFWQEVPATATTPFRSTVQMPGTADRARGAVGAVIALTFFRNFIFILLEYAAPG